MKAPSRNISRSLRGQSAPGRRPEKISAARQTRARPLTAPGEGGVELAPGRPRAGSAQDYAEAIGRRFGRR